MTKMNALERFPISLIESGAGIWREAKEARRRILDVFAEDPTPASRQRPSPTTINEIGNRSSSRGSEKTFLEEDKKNEGIKPPFFR